MRSFIIGLNLACLLSRTSEPCGLTSSPSISTPSKSISVRCLYTTFGSSSVSLSAYAGAEKRSAAIKNKDVLKDACLKFPGKIALGLDAKDGKLSVSGWKESSNKSTLDFLKEVNDYGVSRLIFTDINKDGTKESPNFDETSKVASISNCPVIISGGVSSINDVIKARNMENIEGIIVGKAIYDGDIKLEELVKEDA